MNTKVLYAVVIVLILAALGYFFLRKSPADKEFAITNITAEEVKAKIDRQEDIVLLDVRTPAEFDGPLGHIDGALLIPLNELQNRAAELDSLKDKEIIVYCRSGNRSRYATEFLSQQGFHAVNMLGGMKAWNKLK